jgi:Bacillus transposase protein.
MGLKYTKADGESLVSALTANVSSAEEIINDLQEGVNHLTSHLDNPSSGLSGKAYHAANTLFKQIVVPTLSELKSATATIQSELSTYSFAIKAFDHYPDSVYDKEEFERLLNLKRQQKALTENHINIFMQALSTAVSKTATENLIFEGKGLESVVNHYEKEIQELQDKIQILETVEGQTSSLFEHSLQDFQQALQGAKALKQGSFDSKGNFTFNKGQDLSWYQKLTGKTVDDSLISKKDNEITLKDLLEGNVSKENQATLEQLKSIAKATGMKIEDVWNMFYKYGKIEFDKAKNAVGEHKVSDDDIIKTYTLTYFDPSSKVQHGMEIVYDETTGQVLSQKGWGAEGERESNLAVYGKNAILDNAVQYAKSNFNEDVKELQDSQKLSKGLGKGVSGVAAGFVRAAGINKSLENSVTTSSGKDYNKTIAQQEEAKRKAEEEQEKEERIKDFQEMSSGGPAYFGN